MFLFGFDDPEGCWSARLWVCPPPSIYLTVNTEGDYIQCPAGRVFQYRVGSGIGQTTGYRVGFGSGRSVEKYDRVFPGIFFSFGYFRVFRVFPGMSGIFGYFWVYPYILGLFSNIQWGLKRLQQTKLVLDRSELIRVPRTVLGSTGLWF